MIARRAAFFGLMTASLVAALYTGERLYALIFTLMMAVLAMGGLHVLYTLGSFRFEQSLTRSTAVKGDRVGLRLVLHNEGPIPYANIRAAFWLPDNLLGEPLHLLEGDIPARGELVFQQEFLCAYRGEYSPGLRTLYVGDLFVLLMIKAPFSRFAMNRELRLTVRPRVMALSDQAQTAMVRQGRMDAADVSAQEVSSLRDIRAYRQGDALKWVHFKLSARRRTVLVREFEGSARPKTLLLLDLHTHGMQGAQALETEDAMVEAATALAHDLLEQRTPMRLVAYGKQRYEAAGGEPRDFGPMYAYFTIAAFDGQYPLTDVLTLEAGERHQHIIVVTASLEQKLFGQLLALREAGSDVAAVVVASVSERQRGIDTTAGELRRRGVRCRVVTPGDSSAYDKGASA